MKTFLALILLLVTLPAFAASPSTQQMTNYVETKQGTNWNGAVFDPYTNPFWNIGAVAGTTNRLILSNAVVNGIQTIYLPAGVYPIRATWVIPSNLPPVTVIGDAGKTIITNIFQSSTLVIDAQAAGCVFKDITFTSGSSNAVTADNGSIFLKMNAVGFGKVENCNFINIPGTCVTLGGDTSITARSNHTAIINNVFSNIWNGIYCMSNNASEYSSIINNRMSSVVNDGIYVGGANVLVQGNNVEGWVDSAGGSGTPASTGLRFMSDNGRGHSSIIGNIFNHHKIGCLASNLLGTSFWVGNTFAGGASNIFNNVYSGHFIGNYIDTFSQSYLVSCTGTEWIGNTFGGTMNGWTKGAYSGLNNRFTGGASYTNDVTETFGVLNYGNETVGGNLTITNNANFVGSITNKGGLAMTINIPVITNGISAGTMYITNGMLMKFE